MCSQFYDTYKTKQNSLVLVSLFPFYFLPPGLLWVDVR
jgi:hypothetical protein